MSCPCNYRIINDDLMYVILRPELVLPFSSYSGSCWAFAATEVIESMYLIKVRQ